MKEQISAEALDVRGIYMLLPSLFLLTGILFPLYHAYAHGMSYAEDVRTISVGFILSGSFLMIAFSHLIPFCYKVEVDDGSVYISRKGYLMFANIDQTECVPISEVKTVKKITRGSRVFWRNNTMYILQLEKPCFYGDKIAFLSPVSGRKNLEEKLRLT